LLGGADGVEVLVCFRGLGFDVTMFRWEGSGQYRLIHVMSAATNA
jgi:hypothetical protein